MNGFFTEFDLPEPKTVLKCFPEQTQQDIYDFVPEVLDKACGIKVKEIKELIKSIREFLDKLPESVGECLESNEEARALSEKIGDVNLQQVIAYVTTHFRKVQKEVCALKCLWKEESHREVGKKSALLLKEILKLDMKEAREMDLDALFATLEQIDGN